MRSRSSDTDRGSRAKLRLLSADIRRLQIAAVLYLVSPFVGPLLFSLGIALQVALPVSLVSVLATHIALAVVIRSTSTHLGMATRTSWVLFLIVVVIPTGNLVAAVLLTSECSTLIRRSGIRVGLFGVASSELSRLQEGACFGCGYPLAGLSSMAACPECGKPVAESS